MVCVHSRPPHQGARRGLNCDSYPGHGSQARTFMRVRPPGGGGGPPVETLLLPRNRRPPRRRSCRPVLSSGLILPIPPACARNGAKIRAPRTRARNEQGNREAHSDNAAVSSRLSQGQPSRATSKSDARRETLTICTRKNLTGTRGHQKEQFPDIPRLTPLTHFSAREHEFSGVASRQGAA